MSRAQITRSFRNDHSHPHFAVLAILANGVIYGTDAFSAVVLHPALAALDDADPDPGRRAGTRVRRPAPPVPGVIGIDPAD